MKKIKALVLFSGGLDSIVACKLLEKQGIGVTALSFRSYFFDTQKPEEMAKENGIKLIVRDISADHLGVVRKPKHGYGAAMNPCIDCHALMIKEGFRIASDEGYDMVATGEVLGQRPLSQNRRALETIENDLQAQEKILRPLSAQLMPPTVYEQKGLVDRTQLGAIIGRGRKTQMQMAQEFGVKVYPTPGGGCRLTEKEFGSKLKELLEKVPQPSDQDFELIRFGRHFYLDGIYNKYVYVILGRNAEENDLLQALAAPGDVYIDRVDKKGPTALVREYDISQDKSLLQKIKQLILQYSKNNPTDLETTHFTILKKEEA